MKYIKIPLIITIILAFSNLSFAQKMKPEEIITKHLDSIGTPQVRTSIKSQIAVGDAVVKFISQKNLTAQGRIVLASSADKFFWGLKLNAIDYSTEKFSFDGKKAKVAIVRNGVRSILGNFVLSNNSILEESLLGGVLSTSWALSNMTNKKAKLSFEGEKKIDGKEVYVLGYSPKSGADISINLFFDKETFQHIRTEYKRVSSAAVGRTIDESARQSETRLKLTEDFSDFKMINGLVLPHNYRLLYTTTGQNGTTEIEWNFLLNQFAVNQNLDEKTFDAEAVLQ